MRGGFPTATVRNTTGGFSASAGLGCSVWALPTDENSPVPIHAAKPARTTKAASLWNLNLAIFLSPF